jgi:hypothetical protein
VEFLHQTHGRNPKTALGVALAAALIVYLYTVGTVWWILLIIAALTLPALADLITNTRRHFVIDENNLSWKNRAQDAEIPLSEIEKVKMDGRLDLSVRVTLILRNQRKLRIPQDVSPKADILESELASRAITVERTPLTLL